MIYRSVVFFIFCISGLILSQTYNWPCEPFNQQHWINGTFCECRSGSSGDIDHFHDGIDIHLSEGNPVYSVINEVITSIGTSSQYGINSWVRAGRYAYVHVIPNNSLSVGDSVEAYVTVLGWTNSWNHIHFKDGYPGSERNAIRSTGGISPLIDDDNPHLDWVRFYQNNSNVYFSNNRVFGQIDIVCKAADRTDDGPIGDNNGIYKIGYEILNQSGESVFGPRFPFEFDFIPSTNNYIENVYFNGSNTGTYIYIITNNVYGDYFLNVSNWDPGFYIARIMVYDQYFNADTTDINFEVVEPDFIPPASPQLLSIQAEDNGFLLKWEGNSEDDLAGYRLYFSYDLDQWYNNHTESILTADMTEYLAGSFSNSTGFFKMTAVDDAPFPNESDFSDIYVFRKNQDNQGLLFIDAYNISTPSIETFISNAGVIADELETGMNTVHHSIFTDSVSQILDGTIPYIFSGNEDLVWTNSLVNYFLDTAFSILGSKSISSFNSTSIGVQFLDSLGISFDGNIQLPNQLFGVGEPFADFNVNEIINESLFDSLNIFALTPNNENVYPIIQDQDGHILAVASASTPFIISSIPLELFNDDLRRDYFFRITHFITGISVEIDDEIDIVPDEFNVRFYPNPFNNKGIININGIQGKYSIRLYNIMGQLIWGYSNFIKNEMNYQLQIPANIMNNISSGVYFIHVISPNNKMVSQKVLYLK